MYICENWKNMNNLKDNFSLKKLNTFGLEVTAKYFIQIHNDLEITQLLESKLLNEEKVLILGGGSNILFSDNLFSGLVIKPEIITIETVKETEEEVLLRSGCGIVWDKLVKYCVENGWGGIENLSDIPGLVGAAPIQNIGAYGVELKDRIYSVEAVDLYTGKSELFSKQDCNFGYRTSIFKKEYLDRYLITHITLQLSKKPDLVTHYGGLEERLECYSTHNISTVREIIMQIRSEKLPQTDQLGNAGSFFKNPIIDLDLAAKIHQNYNDMPSYPEDDKKMKIPAAWLIQKAGLKGIRKGNVGTHMQQPLVIVNYGNASGKEIIDFSYFIREKVFSVFGIMLEPEVRFII